MIRPVEPLGTMEPFANSTSSFVLTKMPTAGWPRPHPGMITLMLALVPMSVNVKPPTLLDVSKPALETTAVVRAEINEVRYVENHDFLLRAFFVLAHFSG